MVSMSRSEFCISVAEKQNAMLRQEPGTTAETTTAALYVFIGYSWTPWGGEDSGFQAMWDNEGYKLVGQRKPRTFQADTIVLT